MGTAKLGEPPTVLGIEPVNLNLAVYFWVATDLLPVTTSISFTCPRMSYILNHKEYALFNLFLFLSTMFLRFIHVVACINNLFLISKWYSITWIHQGWCTHSSVHAHLGSIQFWLIVIKLV